MSQLTAMQIRPPQLDMAGAAQKAAQVQGARAQSGLAQLKLRDEGARSDAVHDYREGLKAGDPNASKALKGYPELEAQFQQTFDAMSSAEEKKAAAKKARALGEAARHLSMIPEGREREAAADVVLERLVKDGTIDENMAARAKQTGVTDLFLSQYLSLDEWVKREFPDEDTKLKRRDTESRIAERERKGGGGLSSTGHPMEPLDVKRVEDTVAKFRENRVKELGLNNNYLEPDERAPLLQQLDADTEAFRQRIEAQITGRPQGQPASAEGFQAGRGDLQARPMTGQVPSVAAPPPQQQEGPPRRQGRNPETGEIATFELQNGQWVRVSE